MSSHLDDLLAGLPSADDVGKWEELSRRLGQEISDLTERKRRVDQLIEGAKRIFGAEVTALPPVVDQIQEGDETAPPPLRATVQRVVRGTWTTAILQVAQEHPMGVSYDDVRDALPQSLKDQVARGNNKAFYGSMRRLEEDGLVVRFNSHLFTTEGFEAFKKTAAYDSLSRKGSARRGSPISDATKQFLAENGPSKALAIKEHLCKIPEFRGPIKRNSSALYNILKRLVDRDEIIHDKENSLFFLPNENEAPSGYAAGASETGEVAASPIENQPSLRLIG